MASPVTNQKFLTTAPHVPSLSTTPLLTEASDMTRPSQGLAGYIRIRVGLEQKSTQLAASTAAERVTQEAVVMLPAALLSTAWASSSCHSSSSAATIKRGKGCPRWIEVALFAKIRGKY